MKTKITEEQIFEFLKSKMDEDMTCLSIAIIRSRYEDGEAFQGLSIWAHTQDECEDSQKSVDEAIANLRLKKKKKPSLIRKGDAI